MRRCWWTWYTASRPRRPTPWCGSSNGTRDRRMMRNKGRDTGSMRMLQQTQRSEGVPMPPTLANGKVCYIEMPAVDIKRSADFYAQVFGWRLRQRGDGHVAFDDST